MKKFIILILFLLISTSFAVNDFFSPDYLTSDVTIETTWGTSEKITNVDVVIVTKTNPTTLVLMRVGEPVSEIYLIDGTTIKIYTDNKLIKTLTK